VDGGGGAAIRGRDVRVVWPKDPILSKQKQTSAIINLSIAKLQGADDSGKVTV
jgi:hypothetical protein